MSDQRKYYKHLFSEMLKKVNDTVQLFSKNGYTIRFYPHILKTLELNAAAEIGKLVVKASTVLVNHKKNK